MSRHGRGVDVALSLHPAAYVTPSRGGAVNSCGIYRFLSLYFYFLPSTPPVRPVRPSASNLSQSPLD
jgi:hypothetical protein